MSNIENLTKKILEEANNNKEELLKAAHEQETKILETKIREARAIEKNIIEKANVESITRKDRVISNAELKVRNEKLAAKQEVIAEVFNEVLNKLKDLSEKQYIEYIFSKIISLDITGDEKIIFNKRDNQLITEKLLPEINNKLLSMGKKGSITLSNEAREFIGGFILEKNGIEINNTFEALIGSMKDDLEYEVARVLFN